jgi:hypothetical protein
MKSTFKKQYILEYQKITKKIKITKFFVKTYIF